VLQFGFVFGWLRSAAPLIEVRWLLDRTWLVFLCSMYAAGALVLRFSLRHADDPHRAPPIDLAAQRRAVRHPAVHADLRRAVRAGVAPNHAMSLAVLSLPLIPLTWAYAILRYRLMDVDVIFQEGYVYTLATVAVLAIFYGMIFAVSRTNDVNGTALVALILIAAFVCSSRFATGFRSSSTATTSTKTATTTGAR